MAVFAQFGQCLYCIWPGLVIGIAWWLSRSVEGKTYYDSLTPGVDPVSPQGQAEFDTRRQRDAEKRRIIYWAAGIIALGYLAYLAFNTFTLRAAAAQPTATPSLAGTITASPAPSTPTPTPALPTPTPTGTSTLATGTPTYVPTVTDRIVYLAGKQSTVVVTVIVEKKIYVLVTPTFTSSPTPTPTETVTPTGTATPTGTPTEGE